jgi:hypothetical protein
MKPICDCIKEIFCPSTARKATVQISNRSICQVTPEGIKIPARNQSLTKNHGKVKKKYVDTSDEESIRQSAMYG